MNFQTPWGHALDAIPSVRDVRDLTYSVALPTFTQVPLPAAAAVPGFGVTPVPDQAQLNSCVANAAAYARALSITPSIPLSRLFLWYHARLAEQALGQNVGVQLRDVCKPLLHLGCPPESEEPYDPSQMDNPPTAQELADALPYRIRAYYRQNTITDVKRAVAFAHPILMGALVYPSTVESLRRNKEWIAPEAGETPEGGHCVALGKFYPDPNAKGKVLVDGANWWGEQSTYFTIREDVLMNPSWVFDLFSISS